MQYLLVQRGINVSPCFSSIAITFPIFTIFFFIFLTNGRLNLYDFFCIRRIDEIQIHDWNERMKLRRQSLFFPISHERSLFAQGWLVGWFLNSMQFLCRRMVKDLRTVTFRWENATMLRRVFGFRHGRRRVSAESWFADSGRSVINDNWLLLLREPRFCEHVHCVFHSHWPSNQRISPRVFRRRI